MTTATGVSARRSPPTDRDALRRHLVDDHGRAGHELPEHALELIHELEHLDQRLGLLSLDHVHDAI